MPAVLLRTGRGRDQERLPAAAGLPPFQIFDTLADALDLQDIYVSTGSACHARKDRKNRVSHVLTAQGLTEEQSRSAVRFSLGSDVTAEDIDRVVSATCAAVDRLRRTAGRQAVLQ